MVCLFGLCLSFPGYLPANLEKSNHISQVYNQFQIEQEARRLAEAGYLDQAILKFKEALQPQYIKYTFEEVMSRGSIVKILMWQKKYDEASKAAQWSLEESKKNAVKQGRKGNGEAQFRMQQILALKSYKETNDPVKVYKHMEALKERRKKFLPPNSASPITISTILRLYDTIEDYDAGIEYIDMILNWTFKDDDDFKHLRGKINTVQQANDCMKVGPTKNPDWHACKWLREYLLVRKAFEREKANGGPTCGEWGSKDDSSKYCIGDATQALIQSDYFPW